MDITISFFGALIGLFLAIFLIFKRVNPTYGLIVGALFGGIVGGATLSETVNIMILGAQGMVPAILRIITAGVLAGVLIQSGAAKKIAYTIISKIGEANALIAITIATLILTSIGVFVDVAIITVSPIALEIAKKSNISRTGILLAMVGGGKAGNIISPNPNTIAASENLNIPLTSLMLAGVIPAIFGIIVTCFISKKLSKKGSFVEDLKDDKKTDEMPSFFASIIGPLVSIFLLVLRPTLGINIDPLVALPLGGVCGCLAMEKLKI